VYNKQFNLFYRKGGLKKSIARKRRKWKKKVRAQCRQAVKEMLGLNRIDER